jgi:hypothetical protein
MEIQIVLFAKLDDAPLLEQDDIVERIEAYLSEHTADIISDASTFSVSECGYSVAIVEG